RVALNVCELGIGNLWVLLGPVIKRHPEEQPEESQGAGQHKRPLPAPMYKHPWNCKRCYDSSDICSGVEDTGRECAFLLGEPLRDRLYSCREICGFADSESGSGHPETERCSRQSGGHSSETPDNYCQGVTYFCSEPVYQPARNQQAQSVRGIKSGDDVAVVDRRPSDYSPQVFLENADDLSIDVVDGGREKQQRADQPTVMADTRWSFRWRRSNGGFHRIDCWR